MTRTWVCENHGVMYEATENEVVFLAPSHCKWCGEELEEVE